jgi:hypothetical protein
MRRAPAAEPRSAIRRQVPHTFVPHPSPPSPLLLLKGEGSSPTCCSCAYKKFRSYPSREARPAAPHGRCRTSPSSQSRGRVVALSSSLGAIAPPHAACCPGRATPSPERELQRPPPPGVAVPARRCRSRPISGHQSHPCDHVVLPRCFSGQERRRARRNLAARTAVPPQGLHCKVHFVPKDLVAN